MKGKAKPAEEYRILPLGLVDPPARPARKTFDEDAMVELMESIQDVGLIEPIVVEEKSGRYEIMAGHRRWIAHQNLGMTEIKAIVRVAGAVSGEAIKTHENAVREELNAAEEAVHFSHLLEEDCGGDVDRLCDLVKKNRNYVERRLLLLSGDPDVLAALEREEISFAVAQEINQTKSADYRRVFLESALRAGTSSRQIRQWRMQHDRDVPADAAAPAETGPSVVAPAEPYRSTLICYLCQDEHETFGLELFYIHTTCRRLVLDRLANLGREQLGIMNAGKDGE